MSAIFFHVNNAGICKARTFSLPNYSREELERGPVTHETNLMIGLLESIISSVDLQSEEDEERTSKKLINAGLMNFERLMICARIL
jgi:hypothetical protein